MFIYFYWKRDKKMKKIEGVLLKDIKNVLLPYAILIIKQIYLVSRIFRCSFTS